MPSWNNYFSIKSKRLQIKSINNQFNSNPLHITQDSQIIYDLFKVTKTSPKILELIISGIRDNPDFPWNPCSIDLIIELDKIKLRN